MSSLSRKPFARCRCAALGQTHQAGGSLEDAHPRDPSPPVHFLFTDKNDLLYQSEIYMVEGYWEVNAVNLGHLKSPKRQASSEGLS